VIKAINLLQSHYADKKPVRQIFQFLKRNEETPDYYIPNQVASNSISPGRGVGVPAPATSFSGIANLLSAVTPGFFTHGDNLTV
jgi:hypothetical protein